MREYFGEFEGPPRASKKVITRGIQRRGVKIEFIKLSGKNLTKTTLLHYWLFVSLMAPTEDKANRIDARLSV